MKALSDRPTFQPYWGKPAVRLIGEVVETATSYEARYAPPPYPTIIRSPLRATVLPDRGGRQVNYRPYRDLKRLKLKLRQYGYGNDADFTITRLGCLTEGVYLVAEG